MKMFTPPPGVSLPYHPLAWPGLAQDVCCAINQALLISHYWNSNLEKKGAQVWDTLTKNASIASSAFVSILWFFVCVCVCVYLQLRACHPADCFKSSSSESSISNPSDFFVSIIKQQRNELNRQQLEFHHHHHQPTSDRSSQRVCVAIK